jgi:hypothetical protein
VNGSWQFVASPCPPNASITRLIAGSERRETPFSLRPCGGRNLEQEMMNSMENDDAGAQFNKDVFGPDF